MASTIFFNGRVTAIPGSYSETDATGLAVVGLGAAGIVAALGEAEGGQPGTVISISNPSKVGRTFRSGDLLEAGNMLFDPSKDDQITAGAQEVKFVKVNPALQSSTILANGDGDVLTIKSRDFGLFTTQISSEVADGTTQGKAYTITDGSTGVIELFDNIGGDPAFTALYVPGANGAGTMTMELDNAIGVEADWTKTDTGLRADYDGDWGGIAGEDGEFAATVIPGNVVDVTSSSAGDTTQTVTIIGIDSGSGLPATEVLALAGVGLVVGATTWASVAGVILSAAAVGTVTVRDNGAAVVLTILTPGVLDRGVFDFSADILEVGGDILTLVADGATTDDVILIGKDEAAVLQLEAIALAGVAPAPGIATWSEVQYLAVGLVPAARTLILDGLIWNKGDVARIVSSAPGDTTQRVTFYGLDSLDAPQTEVLVANGTTPVLGTATWNKILAVVMDSAATGTVTAGTAGIVVFTLLAAELDKGFVNVDNVAVSNTTVAWTDDGTSDRTAGLVGLDATGAAQFVTLTSDGTLQTPAETWSEITGVVLGHAAAATTVTISGETFNLTIAAAPTVNDVASFLNALSGWTIAIGVNAGDLEIANLDNQAAVTVIGGAAPFTGDLAFAIGKINDESQIVTFTKKAGATGPPDNTVAPVFLVGGIEGITTFADWQAALDILRDEFVNTIVPLTDDEAIHAAAVSHANYMSGPGRKERDVILGSGSSETLTQIKARAVALNTRHARLIPQDIVRFNTIGEREQFPPYFAGCIAAGMQAGSPVGESLTFKFLNVLDVVGDDATYTLQDDGNELIQGGVCAIEKVQGVGFRWLRNVTTYLIDNNLAFTEASVNEAANFAAFNIRTNLEFATGQKGFQGTVNAAASNVIATLGQLSDPNVQAIVAWQNLTIELEADVMTVDVEIAPVIPVNFVKTTIHLVLASFSAAA